ncbi:MAG: succinylglutamate desuccinylase/aspartoacylase family protein [Geminicoccales bacterium]
MTDTTVFTDIDYDKLGKQVGCLHLPHSPHSDAWGTIAIPIAVIANGEGPTVLATGGNHGDEYEGPIALSRMIRELQPEQVQGRIVIIPALNTPAVLAGRRTSPLDGKNLNRCFPGDPTGTASEQISYYTTQTLFSMADLVMDLHSGGSSLEMIPSAFVEPAGDPEHMQRNIDAVLAFDAPLSIIHHVPGEPRTSNATAVRMGKTMVGSELGGSGAVSIEGLKATERGIYNVLVHLGVVDEGMKRPPFQRRTRLLRALGHDAHVYAPAAGVFEPFHELGTTVEYGEPAGAVHFLDDPGREPVLAHFRASGILFSRRAPGQAVRGSCVAVVGADEEATE